MKVDYPALYSKMETDKLVAIVSLDKQQYTAEAIKAAKAELIKRGHTSESLSPVLKGVILERRKLKEDERKIEEKPLSDNQRTLFILLPGIAFLYYMIFAPCKRRKLEAEKCMHWGVMLYYAFWICLLSIISLHNPYQKAFTEVLAGMILELPILAFMVYRLRVLNRKLRDFVSEEGSKYLQIG